MALSLQGKRPRQNRRRFPYFFRSAPKQVISRILSREALSETAAETDKAIPNSVNMETVTTARVMHITPSLIR